MHQNTSMSTAETKMKVETGTKMLRVIHQISLEHIIHYVGCVDDV